MTSKREETSQTIQVIRLWFENWRSMGRVSPALEVSIDSLEGAVDDLIAVFEQALTPTAGSCWDEAPTIAPQHGECAPVPALCELAAGHAGAHRAGTTEWMRRPARRGTTAHTPTDDDREALLRDLYTIRGWTGGDAVRRAEIIDRAMAALLRPVQGEPTAATHDEHVTVSWAYWGNCLEVDCDHLDEDGQPEDLSACPNVPPFEVCVDCMDEDGRGRDPEHWDDVPLIAWPCVVVTEQGENR